MNWLLRSKLFKVWCNIYYANVISDHWKKVLLFHNCVKTTRHIIQQMQSKCWKIYLNVNKKLCHKWYLRYRKLPIKRYRRFLKTKIFVWVLIRTWVVIKKRKNRYLNIHQFLWNIFKYNFPLNESIDLHHLPYPHQSIQQKLKYV